MSLPVETGPARASLGMSFQPTFTLRGQGSFTALSSSTFAKFARSRLLAYRKTFVQLPDNTLLASCIEIDGLRLRCAEAFLSDVVEFSICTNPIVHTAYAFDAGDYMVGHDAIHCSPSVLVFRTEAHAKAWRESACRGLLQRAESPSVSRDVYTPSEMRAAVKHLAALPCVEVRVSADELDLGVVESERMRGRAARSMQRAA